MKFISTNLVEGSKQGPNWSKCIICLYGLQDLVDEAALRGLTNKGIIRSVHMRMPENLKDVVELSDCHIREHLMNCSKIKFTDRQIAKKARRDLKMQRKSIEEVNAMVMDHIASTLELASNLTQEEVDSLKPKDKIALANQATKLLQGEKKLAIEAKKSNMEEVKFLREVGELASGAAFSKVERIKGNVLDD